MQKPHQIVRLFSFYFYAFFIEGGGYKKIAQGGGISWTN